MSLNVLILVVLKV